MVHTIVTVSFTKLSIITINSCDSGARSSSFNQLFFASSSRSELSCIIINVVIASLITGHGSIGLLLDWLCT